MKTSSARGTILIILLSVVIAWVLVIAATYTELFVNPVYEEGVYVGEEPAIKASTYLIFSAVLAVAIATLVSQRRAIRARGLRGAFAGCRDRRRHQGTCQPEAAARRHRRRIESLDQAHHP